MIVEFQGNTMFNFIIDKHLCYLIENNFDLKDYFDSHMACIPLFHEKFPQFHRNDDTVTKSINLKQPREVFDRASEVFAYFGDPIYLDEENLPAVEYFLINIPSTMTEDPKQLMRTLA